MKSQVRLDLLAFAPHRDDIELTCSGTLIKLIQRGYSVGIVDFTAGEKGSRGSAEVREQEAQEAARIMGVQVRENLGLPDSAVENDRQTRLLVAEKVRRYHPDVVLAPYWEDDHPDHINAGLAVTQGAYLSGLAKLEVPGQRHRPLAILYYMCRRRFEPSFVVDVSEQHALKLEAIKAYRSQFFQPDSVEPRTPLSHPEFLGAIEARSRHYGALIGKEHGEPFFITDALELLDPLAFFRENRQGRWWRFTNGTS
jgi:bacillithiol biosynthesis deacetylase BshB1